MMNKVVSLKPLLEEHLTEYEYRYEQLNSRFDIVENKLIRLEEMLIEVKTLINNSFDKNP